MACRIESVSCVVEAQGLTPLSQAPQTPAFAAICVARGQSCLSHLRANDPSATGH